MSSFVDPLITGIKQALKADAAVAALVGGRIYDEVPADARGQANDVRSPWVVIGPIATARFENDCYRAWTVRVRLICASTAFGRVEGWKIANAVDAVMDNLRLDLGPDFGMQVPFKAAESGDIIDPLSIREVHCDFTCIVFRAEPMVI